MLNFIDHFHIYSSEWLSRKGLSALFFPGLGRYGYCVQSHFQQYFGNIVEANFIPEGTGESHVEF
jgi:hypothetical protein